MGQPKINLEPATLVEDIEELEPFQLRPPPAIFGEHLIRQETDAFARKAKNWGRSNGWGWDGATEGDGLTTEKVKEIRNPSFLSHEYSHKFRNRVEEPGWGGGRQIT